MRCYEARQRLTKSRGIISDADADTQLQKHLEQCPACAAVARSVRALQRDFQSVTIDDNTDGLPLSVLKTRVEARAAAAGSHQENSIMTAFANTMKKRPRLTVTLGAALVVLLVAALIPFKFEQTIGYEVAFAGVDRDLAMDNEKIELLLKTLGCEGAVADVSDCEATCRLKISQLDSENDVKIVTAAFDKLNNCVLEGVDEVCGEASATMFGRARADFFNHQMNYQFRVRPNVVIEDDEAVNQFVIQKLNSLASDSAAPFSIFITGCGEGDSAVIDIEMAGACDSGQIICDSIHLSKWFPDCAPGKSGGMIRIDETADGASTAVLIDEEGNRHVFDLNNAEDIERLNALGPQIDMFTNGGSGRKQIICTNLELVGEDGTDVDPAAKEADEPSLPEGFNLSQNYPNPFNPTTTIAYRLPEAAHVTLEVFNINGQRITTLVDGRQSAGEHSVEWNSIDGSGNRVASGVYFYRLTAGEFSESKKMTLVK